MLFSLDNDIQYQKPQNKVRAIALGIFLIASLSVAAYGVTRAATYSSQSESVPQEKVDVAPVESVEEESYESPDVAKDDHARGVGELQNVLMEYSDFQCPVCAPYASMVSAIEKEFRGKLTVVYRHFPKDTIHENARLAARAAEAAGTQGKFWQMHDLLYQKQNEWSANVQPQDAMILYAKALLLDIKKFTEDMAGQEVETTIQKDFESGQSARVDTVPTFFFNGKKIPAPHTIEEFKKIIAQELEIKQ